MRMLEFLEGSQVQERFSELAIEAATISIAVAFWGADGPKRIGVPEQLKARIVCNLQSGASNPSAIRQLMGIARVRCHPRLHGKLYATDKAAIIGSSNASTNGLALEGQDAYGWEEANVLTNDPTILGQAAAWFERIWNDAMEIDENDLEKAQEVWDQRRSLARQFPTQPRGVRQTPEKEHLQSYPRKIDQLPDGRLKDRLKRVVDVAIANNYRMSSTNEGYPEFCIGKTSVFKLLSKGQPVTFHWNRLMQAFQQGAVQELRVLIDELFSRPPTDLKRALQDKIYRKEHAIFYDSRLDIANVGESKFERLLSGLARFAKKAQSTAA
jgi:hypothetical protein